LETTLRTTERAAEANEWALVLAATGIPHRIESAETGWALLVPDAEVARGHRALRAYENENRTPRESVVSESSPGAVAWTLGITAGLLLVAFFALTGPPRLGSPWFETGAAASGAMTGGGELWRSVTALTLHVDLMHVASNAIAIGLLLPPIAERLGPGLALALVLMAGAGANLLAAAVQAPQHVAVGASTAAFGAIGLLAGLRLRTRSALPATRRRWWVVPAAALILLAMLGTGGGTDVLGHALGMVTGAVLGLAAGITHRQLGVAAQRALVAATALAVVGAWYLALAVSPR
jgi:membrane associated rhomboid family serine protease